MLSRIYLIRHGKTEGNLRHWYYGATDLPLTDKGIEELEAYAESGIYPEIPDDADIYTTGLYRTQQTLEAIYGKRDFSAIPKLQEINFRSVECKTYDELKTYEGFDKWAWDTTGDARIADAETSNEFHKRIHEGLKELLGKHRLKEWSHRHGGQDAVSVVVCHGGVIACIMEKLFPAVCGSMWDWLPEPGFGYAVDFEDSDPYMYTKINDIGRLGLGIYRLPARGERRIDHVKTRKLFDCQMEKGHGYVELDFLDRGSLGEIPESRALRAIKDDFVRKYERSKFNLTAVVSLDRLRDAEDIISKTGAGYLDRLAVSETEKYADIPNDPSFDNEAMADKRIINPEETDGTFNERPELAEAWNTLAKLKKKGLIRKAGLAFAGPPMLLDTILMKHQEIDYVELPVNYRMGLGESDLAQKYYTISRRRYKEILVRSPFDGGPLADNEHAKAALGLVEPDKAEAAGVRADKEAAERETASSSDDEILRHSMAGYAMMKKTAAPKSFVDWALRYVLSFPFVVICVASTCEPDHARENMKAAESFRPLTEDDRKKLAEVVSAK